MKFCTNCGNQLGTEKFCTKCGAPVLDSAPVGTPGTSYGTTSYGGGSGTNVVYAKKQTARRLWQFWAEPLSR